MATNTNAFLREQANHAALERLLAVQPVWSAVRRAEAALAMPARTLLHAGPPLHDPCSPPAPILASAVLCCLHEGWCIDAGEAERLIATGSVRLRPAQDFNCVTPLAAVISPSTTLVEVSDARAPDGMRAYSLLGSGIGPQIRFGTRNPAILKRMKWREEVLAPTLAEALHDESIALLPLADRGLLDGDDLHGRTTGAGVALCEALIPRLSGPDAESVATMLKSTPLFFLTLWMAACHLMLMRAADMGRSPGSTLLVALAGNGEQVGIRLSGEPRRWHLAPAQPPQGPRMQPSLDAAVLPVIGDSGCIDALGFGGQALAYSAEVMGALLPYLPEDWNRRAELLLREHHGLDASGARVGIDVADVVAAQLPPLAAIAMVEASGTHGLLGRGACQLPLDLFVKALEG